ncbi:MAG: type II toxin-antitoxin system PemK/MazF family toxin [Candidatus Devosia phytovorans]|uniref:mRNA interferase n=1 Tax=Candidatus Devosia phytovorans TaxID=3121372 RepID=A0AAJ5VSM5_9HYPH|nr:type II toxin-antitoxin system PemK/MazF family toxin [Devosia sp.]WEK03552.1 MAG: type II toxin-antitoxin system PemK/MazF family toxin [Devosia sp.]
MKRGEVWLTQLDPTIGSEIQKTRPTLIVSPDQLNGILPLVTIVPLTSGSRRARFHVPVHFAGKDGYIVVEQMRSLDKRRLVRRLGVIDSDELSHTFDALKLYFAP